MRSPVLFLIFNRPALTKATFACIREARPPRLYVAADGPRAERPEDARLCIDARQIIDQVDWPCEVKTLFRKRNLGCALAVSSAISWFFQHEAEGIVLEDDLCIHPDFFSFCDAMLERYRNVEQVMCVHGNNFQYGLPRGDAAYYFSCFPHCWGWATWARAWKKYDHAMTRLGKVVSHNIPRLFQSAIAINSFRNLFAQTKAGRLDSWAARWTLSVWEHEGLCVNPNVNMVRNIGFGEEGTHTKSPTDIRAYLPADGLAALDASFGAGSAEGMRHPEKIERNQEADDFVQRHCFGPQGTALAFFAQELDLRLSQKEFAAAAALARIAKSCFGPIPFLVKAEKLGNLQAGNQEAAPEKSAPAVTEFFQTRVLPHILAGNTPEALSEVKRHIAAGGSLDDILSRMRDYMAKETDFGPVYHAYICIAGALRRGNDLGKELREHVSVLCFERFAAMYLQNRGVFSQAKWYRLNKQVFFASLHGLGLDNYKNDAISGEEFFFRSLLAEAEAPTILDVGANSGKYSCFIKSVNPMARIFAFEPHPATYARLQKAGREAGFAAFNFGLSDKEGTITLYARDDHPEGSSHASLYSEVIESLHKAQCIGVEVTLRTLDDTIRALGIEHIDLLKIDTEGHELAVLQGAEKTLRAEKIDCIHFEFNEMNVISRVFLRDFYTMLPGYSFYRMLSDGLVPLGAYGPPVLMELFMYQNVVALRGDAARKIGVKS